MVERRTQSRRRTDAPLLQRVAFLEADAERMNAALQRHTEVQSVYVPRFERVEECVVQMKESVDKLGEHVSNFREASIKASVVRSMWNRAGAIAIAIIQAVLIAYLIQTVNENRRALQQQQLSRPAATVTGSSKG